MVRYLVILLSLFTLSLSAQRNIPIKEVDVYSGSIDEENPSTEELDSLELRDPTNKNLSEGLQKHSPAFVKSYGLGSMATVSFRGAGSSHTKLFWNGTELNSASSGVVDFALIPNFFIDDAELTYGQNTSELSSGALGGIVNLRNRIKFEENSQIDFQQQLGSFDYRSSALKFKSGNFRWQSITKLYYSAAENDMQYYDLSEAEQSVNRLKHARLMQRGLTQSFAYRMDKKQRLDFHLWYFYSDRELPSMMTLRSLREEQKDEQLRMQLQYNRYLKAGKLSLSSSWIDESVEYHNRSLREASLTKNKALRNNLLFQYEKEQWTLKSRLDADLEVSDQLSLDQARQSRGMFSFYTKLRRELSEHYAAELSFRQLIADGNAYSLPEFKLIHRSRTGKWRLQHWFLIGRNVKYPSLNDLYWQPGGNPELKAEESSNAEIGQSIHIQLNDQTKLSWKNTIYYAMIDQYIQWVPGRFGYWEAGNLKKVESKGIESSIALSKTKGQLNYQTKISYNYVSSINLERNHPSDESVGKQLIYRPEHQFNAFGRIALGAYGMDVNYLLVGARYILADNSAYLPYFDLIDISIDRSIELEKHRFQIKFSVNNLLDEEYQNIQWRPMPWRNYMITLNYRLK